MDDLLRLSRGFGQVDADHSGQLGWGRDLSLEALGMRCIGGGQDLGALLLKRRGLAPVHRRRGHEADARVAVLVVVQVDDRKPMLPRRE